MNKNPCWAWMLLLFLGGIPCWGATYVLNGNYGSEASPVGLKSVLPSSAEWTLEDRIQIHSGTSYWVDTNLGPNNATSLGDRCYVDIFGGTQNFQKVNSSCYGWSNAAALTMTVSGQNTVVNAKQIYNWNVGGILTVKDGAKMAVGSLETADGNFTFGTELNLQTGGSLTLEKLNVSPPSIDPESPMKINVSGKSALSVKNDLTIRAGSSNSIYNKDGHTVFNLYGGGNTVEVGGTFSASNDASKEISELNFYLDSAGFSCIQATNVSLVPLLTTAQLQYSGALTKENTYHIVEATGTFDGPSIDNLTYDKNILWRTNKNTTAKFVATTLNTDFSVGNLNFDLGKRIDSVRGNVGWLAIGAMKEGVTYDLTTTFSGDTALWGNFSKHFIQGIGGYDSYSVDSTSQSITFYGMEASQRYLSWDTSTFTEGTFALSSVRTVSSGFTYWLDPVKDGRTGYGTESSPEKLLSQCENISPKDTIIVSSGRNFFTDLAADFNLFPDTISGNRLKIQFTGGTSQFENLNSVMNRINATSYEPNVDLVVSGENTTLTAKRMHNFNQGSSITIQDGGTLSVLEHAGIVYGNTLVVDGGNLNLNTVGIFPNSQTQSGDTLIFRVAHGSNVNVKGGLGLSRSHMTILGDNAITTADFRTTTETKMTFLADATGFGKITSSGNVAASDGTITAGLAGGMVPLRGKEWVILEKIGSLYEGYLMDGIRGIWDCST